MSACADFDSENDYDQLERTGSLTVCVLGSTICSCRIPSSMLSSQRPCYSVSILSVCTAFFHPRCLSVATDKSSDSDSDDEEEEEDVIDDDGDSVSGITASFVSA